MFIEDDNLASYIDGALGFQAEWKKWPCMEVVSVRLWPSISA
jgi:hypothetical protein